MEKINTLPLIGTYNDAYDYNLQGNDIIGKFSDAPDCDTCLLSERRISLTFYDPDPNREHLHDAIVLRHVVENDVERIETVIYSAGTVVQPEDQPDSPRVPYGAYTLTKQ
ncbi:MAG: hypothetical protein GYB32_01350 [Algicola sp.]|nr:hypothetical protein [Algicola sp.]